MGASRSKGSNTGLAKSKKMKAYSGADTINNSAQDPALGDMMDAEKAIAEYLMRAGVLPEKDISNQEKAKLMQRRRQENYLNVECLLKQVRTLRRVRAQYEEDFMRQVESEGLLNEGESTGLSTFDALSKSLELLSVADERRFLKVYAPQIAVGRRYDLALKSLETGMKLLRNEDPEAWQLLNAYYIEGEVGPSVREVQSMFNIASTSTYYNKMEQAKKKLTKFIFGFSSNKAELSSILVFIRQSIEDDYFPE